MLKDDPDYSSSTQNQVMSNSSIRSKRYSGQVEVLTITVDNHLMEDLKNQENYHDNYHCNDKIHVGIEHLIGTYTSEAVRFYTPWQCLWRHCSIGLFSTSGQGMATWSMELAVTLLFFHLCWSHYNSSYLVV